VIGVVWGDENLLQHHQGRVALGRAVRLKHFRVHDQPVAILHQQIPAATQFRLLPLALARQQSAMQVAGETAVRCERSSDLPYFFACAGATDSRGEKQF
jgi:hypothetical protein